MKGLLSTGPTPSSFFLLAAKFNFSDPGDGGGGGGESVIVCGSGGGVAILTAKIGFMFE